MMTQEVVAQKIVEYLNGGIDLPTLVAWSEDALLELTESSDEVINVEAMMRALGYIGAGDTPDFPLTWEVLSDLLVSLGVKAIHVEAA